MNRRLALAGTILLLGHSSVALNRFKDTGHSPAPELFENSALRSIGRFYDTENNSTDCTATLIALKPGIWADTIMLAAHCFINEHGKLRTHHHVFVIGGKTGKDGMPVDILLDTVVALEKDWYNNPARDAAFVKLAQSLDPKKVPPAIIKPITDTSLMTSDNFEFKITSYSFDPEDGYADGPPTTETCAPADVYLGSRAFTHDCSVLGGSSGAPLYIIENGVIEIVGINVGAKVSTHRKVTAFAKEYANRAVEGQVLLEAFEKYSAGNLEPGMFPYVHEPGYFE